MRSCRWWDNNLNNNLKKILCESVSWIKFNGGFLRILRWKFGSTKSRELVKLLKKNPAVQDFS